VSKQLRVDSAVPTGASARISRVVEKRFTFLRSCRYIRHRKKPAYKIFQSVHSAALVIVTSRTDLPVPDQEALYDRGFFELLEDNVRSMSVGELLNALAI